jgi:hypothetical protein
VNGDQLPAEHYVARHCPNKNLILTNGEPTGVSESAFEPNPDESDGLSANWLEFFGNDRQHNVAGVRSVTKLTVRLSHRIAILNVGAITTAGGSAILRWVEDPIDDLAPYTNAAHVIIKEIVALKDRALREVLAFLVQQSDIERY